MENSWYEKTFADVLEITSSKRIFKADYVESGVPFYRGKEIIDKFHGRDISTDLYISENRFIELSSKFGAPEPDDMLLTSVGTIGIPYLVKNGERFYFKDGNLTWFRNYSEHIHPKYIYTWFSSPLAKQAIDEITIGSTQQALTISALKKLKISLPPLQEQKAIAHILGTLDDKIELNRQTNKTLESIARAIFKSWFVDFDPVRAKLDGKTADLSLSPEILDLFPDSFQDSELGEIPVGWEVRTLGSLAKNASITYKFEDNEEVVFVNTGDVLLGDFLHNNFSRADTLPGQAKKRIAKDDILFSEIRPRNNRFAYVLTDCEKHVVSTKFMVIRSNESILPQLLFIWITTDNALQEFQILAETRSGTFPQITFDSIEHFPIVLPCTEIQNAFYCSVDPFNQKVIQNKAENKILKELRDTLLPKLISGELRIKDAEKFLKDAPL